MPKLWDYLLLLVPMFITDRVALILNEYNEYEVLCLEEHVQPSDEKIIFAYGSVSCFTWLGMVIGGKEVDLD